MTTVSTTNAPRGNIMRIQPSADCCFGRSELARAVVSSAEDCQSVVLYGGRQSGKTTLLKYIESQLGHAVRTPTDADERSLGVYVDLLRLPYDADPASFYRTLVQLAAKACSGTIAGFEQPILSSQEKERRESIDTLDRKSTRLNSSH